jgi:hypothetical protein
MHAGHDDAGLDFGQNAHDPGHDLSQPDLSLAADHAYGDHLHAGDDLSSAYLAPPLAGHPVVADAPDRAGRLGASDEIGNPAEYQHYWFFQQHNGYCVPSSVTQVIEAQTGISMHGYNLVEQEAHHLGVPTGAQGLTLEQARELLNGFDIPSHVVQEPSAEAGVTQLAHDLEQGKNVILSVNASPIWYGSATADNPSGQADHALVVTAINTETGTVTLSDPGSPTGNEEHVPLSTFIEAWGASHYQMLVTDDHVGGADHSAATADVDHLDGGSPGIGTGIAHGLEFAAGFVILPIVLVVGLAGAAVYAAEKADGRPGQARPFTGPATA